MIKVKIISDGTTTGTRLVNADTGEDIQYVTKIKIYADVKQPFVTADIEFTKVPIEITNPEILSATTDLAAEEAD